MQEFFDKHSRKVFNQNLAERQGSCTIETGFVWSDILTDLERSADHCANIAESVLEGANHHLATHASVRRQRRGNPLYKAHYEAFAREFQI